MSKDGEWAGHLELLAIAHACNVDVIIHQVNQFRVSFLLNSAFYVCVILVGSPSI